jgi:antitoxin (DNA-binding transcriptional repressor) of toxin-antitoxin stability system
MKQIAAATFKKECLALLDNVDPDGIVIIKDGKPVAKLIPLGADSATATGSGGDHTRIAGKVVSTGQEWGC